MGRYGLARGSVGAVSLWATAVGASSPMTVVTGGIVATYAATGVVSVPLAFVVVTVVLVPLLTAYVMASRHIRHAAPSYALMALALGGVSGTAGAGMALLAYNCIQISLYGLLGASLDGWLSLPWWQWALVAWVLVGVFGTRSVRVGARVMASLVVCGLGLLTWFAVVAFTDPGGGAVSWEPWNPGFLLSSGVGGVLTLTFAAFVGVEVAASYAEESATAKTVTRATFAALAFVGVFYAGQAWAMASTVGPAAVAGVAGDPAAGWPMSWFADRVGGWVEPLWLTLQVAGILVALLSFHHAVARHVFALGRERVMWGRFAQVKMGRAGGAPVAASLLQSAIALVVIVGCEGAGIGPFSAFAWLSTVAATAVLALLVCCSWAAYVFFARNPRLESGLWASTVAPLTGVLAGVTLLWTMLVNADVLLGLPPDSPLAWLPGVATVGAAVLGACWGLRLRGRRPGVFRELGRGRPHPLAQLDHGMPVV